MYIEKCSKDQEEKIYKDLGTTQESLRTDVESLMEWLEKQPHLPNVEDEEFLRTYLLQCKNSLEKAKQRMEQYFISKVQSSNLFINRDPGSEEFRKCFQFFPGFPLRKLTADADLIYVARINPLSDVPLPNAEQYLRYFLIQYLLVFMKSGMHRKSSIILDYKNTSVSHIPLLSAVLNKFVEMMKKLAPIRYGSIYILNLSPVVEPLLILGRIFPKDIQERFVFWKKNDSDLSSILPKDMLPVEYGGTAAKCSEFEEQWLKEMISWKEWLDYEEKIVADLKKRPADAKIDMELAEFGIGGSFRKLNFD